MVVGGFDKVVGKKKKMLLLVHGTSEQVLVRRWDGRVVVQGEDNLQVAMYSLEKEK